MVEVWAIRAATGPRWLLTVLATTLLGVGLLTQVEGFRQALRLHPIEALLESIEAVAIGVVCAALSLDYGRIAGPLRQRGPTQSDQALLMPIGLPPMQQGKRRFPLTLNLIGVYALGS